MSEKIAFLAADTDSAQAALHELTEIYGQCDFKEADYIVALGGDGFMLQTLHLCQNFRAPVYGMNRGTVGFMMNAYETDALPLRLSNAEEQIINPLIMKATLVDGKVETALAINEVSLLRAGPQAAKLQIWVDNRQRMDELVCDGVLVATPAGSTAYNYSAHEQNNCMRLILLAWQLKHHRILVHPFAVGYQPIFAAWQLVAQLLKAILH